MAGPRKVGVLTFHRCINYGSYWQARCLAEGLASRGLEVELLDHRSPRIDRAEWRCALQPTLPRRVSQEEARRYAAKSRRFFEAFEDLPLSAPFSLETPELPEAYATVVVGSDEVWNFRHPWYSAQRLFFGDALESRRLVAYAASFGGYDAAEGLHPWWAAKLARFSALAVRDDNSRELLRNGVGVDPAVVLDPCLQFSSICRRPPNDRWNGYAVVYGHSFASWFQEKVRRWAAARGLRLLSLGYGNDWTDEQRITAGPEEFASIMAGARAVVTNFFHGCVFALANARPFVTLLSDYRSHKIGDLMKRTGLGERLVDPTVSTDRFEGALDEPPGPQTAQRIEALRRQSETYLDLALA
jgi:hypothetical protein